VRRRALLLLGLLCLAGGLAALLGRHGRARAIARRILGYPASRKRLAARAEPPPFAHLATSQVGYGPGMAKEFTSSVPFAAFRVVEASSGVAVFTGGAPARSLRVTGLGPFSQVWVGDFSGLVRPGRYRVELDGGRASYPFDVGPGAFDTAVRAVQRVFYYQRAFTALEPAHAEGPWFHPSDADRAPPGVRMGWHDAGDFSLYSASLNTALFWLLETASDFPPGSDDTNIPESGNGVPDLLDETRWGVEWLLSVQDGSGGFRNSTCLEHYGPYGTNTPERAGAYRPGEVGTIATGRAVGNLAYASVVYRTVAPELAARCLAAARRGDAYLRAHAGESTDGPTCPALRSDGDPVVGHHMRMFAAAGMLLATGDPSFREDFEQNYVELDYDPSYVHYNGFAAQLYLRAAAGDEDRKRHIRDRLRLHADRARADGDQQPFRWAPREHWGSISAAFTRAGSYSVKRCLEDPHAARADCEQALANVHYLLGRNYLQFCYVSGLPGVTRGRQWAFHHWLATLRAEPHLFPGMVAGGPNAFPEASDVSKAWGRPIPVWGYWGDPAFPRDGSTPFEARFTDNDSWSTNEISIEWQATALYNLSFARWMARGGAEREGSR
jgi:endoglucanase